MFIFSWFRPARENWKTIQSLTPAESPRWGSLSTTRLLSRQSRLWSCVISKTSRCSSSELLKNTELETVKPKYSYKRRNCSLYILHVCYYIYDYWLFWPSQQKFAINLTNLECWGTLICRLLAHLHWLSTVDRHNKTIIHVLCYLDRKANAIYDKHETFRILLTYISDNNIIWPFRKYIEVKIYDYFLLWRFCRPSKLLLYWRL